MSSSTFNGITTVYFSSLGLSLLELVILIKRSRGRKWFDNPDIFLLNLAFFIFIFGVVGTSGSVTQMTVQDIPKASLNIFRTASSFATIGAVIALAVLTADMYIAAIYPFKLKLWRTRRNVSLALLSCWMLTGALGIAHQLKRWSVIHKNTYCERMGINLSTFITGIFLGFAYWRIFQVLRRSRKTFNYGSSKQKKHKAPNENEVSNRRRLAEKRLSHLGVFTTCFFVILTTPYVIMNIVNCAGYAVTQTHSLYLYMIYMARSPVHSIIFLVSHFLQQYRKSKTDQNGQLQQEMMRKAS